MAGPFDLGNIFRTTPAPQVPAANAGATGGAPAAAAAPNNQGLDQANLGAGAGTGGNGTQPLDGTEKKGAGSGLDGFTDLFKIDDKKAPAGDPLAEPLFKLDPKILAEHVNKMDFSRGITPELQAKIFSGNPAEAGPALQSAINGATRAALMSTMQIVVGLSQQAFDTNNKRFDGVLSGRFRDFQIRNTQSGNKTLQHPAVQPVLAALRDQIARQYPDLQAHDVSKKADDYFLEMNKAMNVVGEDGDGTGGNKSAGAAKEPDWSTFAG